MARRSLTVVKLGGSFAGSPRLRDWLDALARCGGHVVVVPGGGPFADTVRSAQAALGFDDRTAHRMAVLAMEQYACALAGLDARLVLADSIAALRRVLRRNGTPAWMPARMVLAAADVPWSWDVTSDSLAVWLAGRLGADRVVLVKQVAPPEQEASAADLAARGIIDPACADFMRAVRSDVFVLGADQWAQAEHGFITGSIAGTRVSTHLPGRTPAMREPAGTFI